MSASLLHVNPRGAYEFGPFEREAIRAFPTAVLTVGLAIETSSLFEIDGKKIALTSPRA